jgi:hypothetical protein
MINITSIARQMLWAFVAVMAVTGEASAQMALAVIAKGGIPYYASIQDVGIAPPLGQFAANAHLCMKNAVVTRNGRKFLQFFIQSRGMVYVAFNLDAVSRNPAADRDCELMAQQGNSSTEPTSADSAKAGSLASSPNQEAIGTQVNALLNKSIESANMDNCKDAGNYVGQITTLLKSNDINISIFTNDHTAFERAMQARVVQSLSSIQACEARVASASGEASNQATPSHVTPPTMAATGTPTVTSVQSASPEQPTSEAAQAQSNRGGTRTDAGSTTKSRPGAGSAARSFAATLTVSVPYYKGDNYEVVATTPPIGQFVANQHVCVIWAIERDGKQFAHIVLPGDGAVFTAYDQKSFIPDPANNAGCVGAVQQFTEELGYKLAHQELEGPSANSAQSQFQANPSRNDSASQAPDNTTSSFSKGNQRSFDAS